MGRNDVDVRRRLVTSVRSGFDSHPKVKSSFPTGDPVKAARAIANAVRAEKTALRLPLGGDAVDSIRSKLMAVTADVDRTEAIARATAF
jgi:hypothetical protein